MVAKGYYDQTRSATYQYHHNSTTNCNVTAYELGYHIYLEQIIGSHFWEVQPLPSPTLPSALEPVLSSSIMNHPNAKGSDTSQNSLPSVRDSDTKRFVLHCCCPRQALFEQKSHLRDNLQWCLLVHGLGRIARPHHSSCCLHGSSAHAFPHVEGHVVPAGGRMTQDHDSNDDPTPEANKIRRTSSPCIDVLTGRLPPSPVIGYQQSRTRPLREKHFQAFQGAATTPLYQLDDLEEEILISLSSGRYSNLQESDDDCSVGTVDSLVLARNRLR
jgi:hypothetical protein